MGIPGLWKELEPAASSATLPVLSLTAFSANTNKLRGITIGIDASLWLYHVQKRTEGYNGPLRILFFRLADFLKRPLIPLFVFDGPNRPARKRGKLVQGRELHIETQLAELIDAFGFKWRRARGEAEAELAHLNATGVIDAVLSDDSDTLVFGANTVIRNWSMGLPANKALTRADSKASEVFSDSPPQEEDAAPDTALAPRTWEQNLTGKDQEHLIFIFKSSSILEHPRLGLDRDGLILVALLAGGDYDQAGLVKCGIKVAVGLARSGFGTSLINTFRECYAPDSSLEADPKFTSFVLSWAEEVRSELRTNSMGFLPSKRPKTALVLTDAFLATKQSLSILACYVYPLTSEQNPASMRTEIDWADSELDLTRLAELCQSYFNWTSNYALERLRSLVWEGAVVHRLRKEAVTIDTILVSDQGPVLPAPADSHVLAAKPARITDFFANGRPAPQTTPALLRTGLDARSFSRESIPATVDIRSITKQKLHPAWNSIPLYRAQVHVQDFVALAQQGFSAQVDVAIKAAKEAEARIARANREAEGNEASPDDSEKENSPVAEPGSPTKKRPTAKPKPDDPLLMWIAEPLLKLSHSGAQALASYLDAEQKKLSSRALTKTMSNSKVRRGPQSSADAMRGQMSLTAFLKPQAKAALLARPNAKALLKDSERQHRCDQDADSDHVIAIESDSDVEVLARTPAIESDSDVEVLARTPAIESDSDVEVLARTPRKLIVPPGMQRTSSSSSSSSVRSHKDGLAQGRTGSLQKYTSLPVAGPTSSLSRTVLVPDVQDPDSSIEFLNMSSHRNRSPDDSDGPIRRKPRKSPRTSGVSCFTSPATSVSTNVKSPEQNHSQRILEALFGSASDEEEDLRLPAHAPPPPHKSISNAKQRTTRKAKDRNITIDISSSSSEAEA